ncbi:MAG TPA: hypothetical protein ENF80_05015 [Thermofilum sp.]|nr:hypothetical protein [Thermofilum sp.]
MCLIDTNIFLEVMLRRSRSGECKELLKMLRDGKVKGVVTDFTVHSIIVLLRTITMIFLHIAPLSSYMLVRLSSKNKLAIMALVNLLGTTSTYLITLYWIIGLSRVVT